jgi:drug/metabolite transporter (DMT)-like permease
MRVVTLAPRNKDGNRAVQEFDMRNAAEFRTGAVSARLAMCLANEESEAVSSRRTAILMLLLATAAWGYSFPGGKALQIDLAADFPTRPGIYLAALMLASRFGVAAVILWIIQPRAFACLRPGEWRQGIGLGVFSGLGMLLQADGLNYTTASAVAFLTQGSAVLIPLWVAFRDRRLPGRRTVLCVFMVIAGVAILGEFDWRALHFGRGEAETLISSCFFTAQILWLDRPIFRGNDMLRVSLVMFLAIACVLALVVAKHAESASELLKLVATGPRAGLFVSLTAVCSLLAFLLMNHWQPHVEPTTAGIIYCAEPLFATAMALFMPAMLASWLQINYANEVFTPHLLLGGGLITVANVLIALKPVEREPSYLSRSSISF